ncbi:hypothetical protein K439DRAFT_1655979 [Ramaria rubella]|nr:hypothetical protein K439DRAFT_1655979 [Ramaria rubella]
MATGIEQPSRQRGTLLNGFSYKAHVSLPRAAGLILALMSLPTFSELMASLQLTSTEDCAPVEEDSDSSSPSQSRSPSPTATCQHIPSSTESPSIVISQIDSSHPTRPSDSRATRSLGRSNRFAPYLGATNNVLHLRRSSLSDVFPELEPSTSCRASSASPPICSNTLRDVSMNAARPVRSHKVVNIDTQTDVPISSFARRHTPQSSPTASMFPHRRRSTSSQDSFSPVLLPTLLPGLTAPPTPNSVDLMGVSDMENMSKPLDAPKSHNLQQGLRLSSYRATSQSLDGITISYVRSAA